MAWVVVRSVEPLERGPAEVLAAQFLPAGLVVLHLAASIPGDSAEPERRAARSRWRADSVRQAQQVSREHGLRLWLSQFEVAANNRND